MGASMADGSSASRSARRSSARYAAVGGLVPQGISAELIAEKWGISREDIDAFSVESHQRAAARHRRGPLRARDRADRRCTTDDGDEIDDARRGHPPRLDDREARQAEAGVQADDGMVTAGNSSQITDGAAARADHERGEGQRARPHARGPASTRSPSPASTRCMMLTGPIPATDEGARAGRADASTTSTSSRSTRRSPRSCWRGRRSTTPT